jgi:hypothetical protein
MIKRFFNPTPALLLMAAALWLSACSSYQPGWEEPTVALRSFQPLDGSGEGSGGIAPGFKIELGIVNPNREALNIEGISYTISLQGHDLVKGVGKDFPVIEGYGTGVISLQAQTNLLAGIGLIRELISKEKPDRLIYEFSGKIDLGAYRRAIRFSEKGDFSMNQSRLANDYEN